MPKLSEPASTGLALVIGYTVTGLLVSWTVLDESKWGRRLEGFTVGSASLFSLLIYLYERSRT